MTRWQDDIKDNIMEPILKRHKYTRAYKDGEKQHLPVVLYKRAMEEKNLVSNMLGFIKKEIFDTLKEWLVEPIYKAIDEMMRGHWL